MKAFSWSKITLTQAYSSFAPLLCMLLLMTSTSLDPRQLAFAQAEAPELVVIINGGWSCHIAPGLQLPPYDSVGIRNEFKDHLPQIAPRFSKIHEIFSCFGASSHDTVNYFLPSTGSKAHRSSFETYFQDVVTELAAFPKAQVAIIGHSYGAWLSIQTAHSILKQTSRTIAGLTTIDPISPAVCRVLDYQKNIGHFVKAELQTRDYHCLGIPEDLDLKMRQTIAAGVGFWDNYFQKNTIYLHAAAFPEATRNVEIEYPWYTLSAHSAVDTHSEVWGQIHERMLRFGQPGLSSPEMVDQEERLWNQSRATLVRLDY